MKMALLDFQCLTKQGKTPGEEDDEDCHHDSCDDGPVDDGVDSVPSCLLFIEDIGVGKAIAKQLENRAPGDEAEDKDVGEDEKEHVDRKAGTTLHPSQTAVDGEVEQAMHAFSQQGFHGGIFEARRREFLGYAREDGIHAAGASFGTLSPSLPLLHEGARAWYEKHGMLTDEIKAEQEQYAKELGVATGGK